MIVVQALPAGARGPRARWPRVAPNGPVVVQLEDWGTMKLVQLASCECDGRSVAVVVEPLPARTGIPSTRATRKAPDPAIGVLLEELAVAGQDGDCFRVVVEPLPARTRIPVARSAGKAPDPAIIM